MNDDQLSRLFQTLDEPALPDPAFADALFHRLQAAPPATAQRGSQMAWALVAAALLAAAIIGAALAVGSGLINLPFVILVPSPQPSSTPLFTNPSQARLAYAFDGDIYLADWDGANPVRVADGPSGRACDGNSADRQMWSPDGRYFAFRSGCWGDSPGHPPESVTATVHISDSEGRPVASVPGEGWRVAWSPDSSRFATWDDFEQSIFVYGVDGERQARLVLPAGLMGQAGLGDYDPIWSPDGTALLLPPFRLPVDGGPVTRVASDDSFASHAIVVSPDGRKIAFSDGRWLRIANADGSDVRVVSRADVIPWRGVVWSPSGDRVVFVSDASGVTPQSLRIVDVATGTVTLLFRPERTGDLVGLPSW